LAHIATSTFARKIEIHGYYFYPGLNLQQVGGMYLGSTRGMLQIFSYTFLQNQKMH
jgi:hypothetical protein